MTLSLLCPSQGLFRKTPHSSGTSVHALWWTLATSVLIAIHSASLVCGRNSTLPKPYISPFDRARPFPQGLLETKIRKRLTGQLSLYAMSHFCTWGNEPGSVTDVVLGEECWLLYQKHCPCTVKVSSAKWKCQVLHIPCLCPSFYSVILLFFKKNLLFVPHTVLSALSETDEQFSIYHEH